MEVWIGRDGERHGPYKEEDVRAWLRSGEVSGEDLGWREGLADWQPLSVLFPDAVAGAPPPFAPPPSPGSAPAWPQHEDNAALTDYAGFWQRFGAWLIDYVILLVPSSIVGYAMGIMPVMERLVSQMQAGGSMANMTAEVSSLRLISAVVMLIGYAYYVFFECSKWQATPGKLALNLRVTDLDGKRITPGRSLARNAVRLTNIITGLIPFVCYIAVAWTRRKQGLHDLLASTLVLNGRADRVQAPRPAPSDRGGHGSFDA
ncbi:RDD family protein [Frateuria defendens]|uniref:RDD family protein n=1 Tax=Frateuria defendens TaxID=2219559 RepID=UPI0007DBF903|nr:RDD family protein [Frateuria defendens]